MFLDFIYESTSPLNLVKFRSFFESTALFNLCIEYMIEHVWLFTLILISSTVIAYYVILLSNSEDFNVYGYRTLLSEVGASEDDSNNPISRKVGAQAATNERQRYRGANRINYRDYTGPVLGMNMDERVLFANLLASSPARDDLDIDRVYGVVKYKGTNKLVICNSYIFACVWQAEKDMRNSR